MVVHSVTQAHIDCGAGKFPQRLLNNDIQPRILATWLEGYNIFLAVDVALFSAQWIGSVEVIRDASIVLFGGFIHASELTARLQEFSFWILSTILVSLSVTSILPYSLKAIVIF
jgi:hypothetical protein